MNSLVSTNAIPGRRNSNDQHYAHNERSLLPITGNYNRILPCTIEPGTCPKPLGRLQDDLVRLSDSDDAVSELSRKLFTRLRKTIGTAELTENLMALQYLAWEGNVAGVRLLAAYLDVTTAGARLIPHLRRFHHSRRQMLFLDDIIGDMDDVAKEWRNRARRLGVTCFAFKGVDKGIQRNRQEPSVCMQAVLEILLSQVVQDDGISPENRTLLVELLRMETDAWQERISRLAGTVNPFRISAIQRLLPILNRADTNIRDLRQLIGWVKEGQDRNAFIRHGSRALEVLEEPEFRAIHKALKENEELRPLSDLHTGGHENPAPLAWLGTAVARLLALDFEIVKQGFESHDLDIMSAVGMVQKNAQGAMLAIPLNQNQEKVFKKILSSPPSVHDEEYGRGTWLTEGLSVEVGKLVLSLPPFNEDLTPWPHGLPGPEDTDPARPIYELMNASDEDGDDKTKAKVMDGTTIKKLVFDNITSTSVLLGFLRNPKVTAVPGLVAAVASRTRNPQVIETIATDRNLYTGFANRDVPFICLQSPCNVSPKTLRKFIHVKYVSKVDLRRMAADRSGIRKDVAREIELYLEMLG